MWLRTQSVAPLETIYEESGSFIASNTDIQKQLNIYEYKNEIINGLISSRSIPTVDIHRQRAYENPQRLPIEVRFRDGSKRYIQPSTTAAAMIRNRRKLFDSSYNNLSSKNFFNPPKCRPVCTTNITKKKFQTKPPLVITIITADDLNQANISPNGSDRSSLIQSKSNSSMNTIRSLKDFHEASFDRLSNTFSQSPVQSIISDSVPISHSATNLSQQTANTHRQNLTPAQLHSKPLNSSLQINLTNDENDQNSSYTSLNHTNQQNPTISVGGGTHSAFRPFLKQINLNQQITRGSLPINGKTYNPSFQQQQKESYFQQYQSISSTNLRNISLQQFSTQNNAIVSSHPYNSMKQTTNQSPNINNYLQMNSSNYEQQQSVLASMTTNNNNNIDNSLILSRGTNISSNPGQNHTFGINSNVKFFSVKTNFMYDKPNATTKYPGMPFCGTVPMKNSMQNQKLNHKQDTTLENRLLNAGLSPETIALYERVLGVNDNRQKPVSVSSKINDQYSYMSFI